MVDWTFGFVLVLRCNVQPTIGWQFHSEIDAPTVELPANDGLDVLFCFGFEVQRAIHHWLAIPQ